MSKKKKNKCDSFEEVIDELLTWSWFIALAIILILALILAPE